jgi:hypothetical protein
VHPDLLARRRIERDKCGRVAPQAVQHVVGEHRAEHRRAVRVEPCHFELTDIGFLDLIEGLEIRTVETGQRLDLSLRGRHCERNPSQKCDDHRDDRGTACRAEAADDAGGEGFFNES